nr:MAG TPA: hypothetical protein [Caudoviricetes sp.]
MHIALTFSTEFIEYLHIFLEKSLKIVLTN